MKDVLDWNDLVRFIPVLAPEVLVFEGDPFTRSCTTRLDPLWGGTRQIETCWNMLRWRCPLHHLCHPIVLCSKLLKVVQSHCASPNAGRACRVKVFWNLICLALRALRCIVLLSFLFGQKTFTGRKWHALPGSCTIVGCWWQHLGCGELDQMGHGCRCLKMLFFSVLCFFFNVFLCVCFFEEKLREANWTVQTIGTWYSFEYCFSLLLIYLSVLYSRWYVQKSGVLFFSQRRSLSAATSIKAKFLNRRTRSPDGQWQPCYEQPNCVWWKTRLSNHAISNDNTLLSATLICWESHNLNNLNLEL